MAFSGALTLTDLNDFITPSQACIKPVEQIKPSVEVAEPGEALTQIRVDSSGGYYEVKHQKAEQPSPGRKLQTAQISLNDCLACSGCITSAESVLITMQSHEEVLSFLSSNPPPDSTEYRLPVLSISPQSLASLAASTSSSSHHPISPQTVLRRVQAFCRRKLGFPHVFDTTFARHLALLEHGREYNERKVARGNGENVLPMLASACPGWVCYAEKAHAEMLPFISRTKSPQQIMGTLVKRWMAEKWGRNPQQIYHVSVMPCYDKKLEASRQDFYNDVYKTRDVDCVITTGELQLLMQEKVWDLSTRVEGDEGAESLAVDYNTSFPALISHPGTSSGSYLHSLISLVSASQDNLNRDLKLNSRMIRSADYEEYTLEDVATGEIIFKGAKCYGFRNLQNIVRKVGKENGVRGLPGGAVRGRARRKVEIQGTTDRGYDYVEVMACPSGCVNGGGQILPPRKILEEQTQDVEGYQREWTKEGVLTEDAAASITSDPDTRCGNKDWTRKVEAVYWSSTVDSGGQPISDSSTKSSSASHNFLAARILADLCLPASGSVNGPHEDDSSNTPSTVTEDAWMQTMNIQAEERRRDLFRTSYRKVESEIVGIAVKW